MEHLKFENLNDYLLLKNGNYLYKVPFRDGFAVIKLYYGSRGWLRRLYKTFDNVVMCGQTSFMPKARFRTEQKAIHLWRDAGIRVLNIYKDVVVEGLPEGGYGVYEYVEGRNIHKFLADDDVPIPDRITVYRKFLDQWRQRHEIAVERREPYLIHENGDLKHVFVCPNGELVWFDFEMCFRSRAHVDDLVAREILAYLKSLKMLKPGQIDLFFNETMAHYGNRKFLENVYPVAFKNRNLIVRWARRLDYRFVKRSQKPHSKYNMAKRVKQYLNTHPAESH